VHKNMKMKNCIQTSAIYISDEGPCKQGRNRSCDIFPSTACLRETSQNASGLCVHTAAGGKGVDFAWTTRPLNHAKQGRKAVGVFRSDRQLRETGKLCELCEGLLDLVLSGRKSVATRDRTTPATERFIEVGSIQHGTIF
jgi:hypothetical protein